MGQLAAMCAWARGAKRVIAIDEVPARLEKVKVQLSLPGRCMRQVLTVKKGCATVTVGANHEICRACFIARFVVNLAAESLQIVDLTVRLLVSFAAELLRNIDHAGAGARHGDHQLSGG